MSLQLSLSPVTQPIESHPAVSFWQQAWVQNRLPFCTSLAVHAGTIILAIAFATAVASQVISTVVEEQTIIPESMLADADSPGNVPNVGNRTDPFRQAMQDKDPNAGTPEGWASTAGPLDALVTAVGNGADESDSAGLIGIGTGWLGQAGGIGAGTGDGTGGGHGNGEGPLAIFGTPGGGVLGPNIRFFGCCPFGSIRKIVFVCDASGSMISKMATLKNELNRAVTSLKPVQHFNIIFFQGDSAVAMNPEGMVVASKESKRTAVKFLDDMKTGGASDPIPALRLAFKQQPHLIYLLTDGDFPDNAAVLNEIRGLNNDTQVKVSTIAFVNDRDTDTAFIDLLTTIAKENGGHFKHVAENESSD